MATFTKILVPVDGSEPSNQAVELAVRIAKDQGARLLFLHVCEVARIAAMVSVPAVGVDPSFPLELERQYGEDVLARAAERAEGAGVIEERQILDGGCVDGILDVAEQEAVDLIVIGSHGRSGLPRAFLGSVAEGVLRRANVPVLVSRTHG